MASAKRTTSCLIAAIASVVVPVVLLFPIAISAGPLSRLGFTQSNSEAQALSNAIRVLRWVMLLGPAIFSGAAVLSALSRRPEASSEHPRVSQPSRGTMIAISVVALVASLCWASALAPLFNRDG